MLFLVQSICVYKANFVIISASLVYTGLYRSEVLYASLSILKKHHNRVLNFKIILGYDNLKLITAFEMELESSGEIYLYVCIYVYIKEDKK